MPAHTKVLALIAQVLEVKSGLGYLLMFELKNLRIGFTEMYFVMREYI